MSLEDAAKTAAAQLRHAYGNHKKTGQPVDPGLVAQAIRLLEVATTPNPPTVTK